MHCWFKKLLSLDLDTSWDPIWKPACQKLKGHASLGFMILINHLLIVIIIVYNPFLLGQNLLLFKICFEKNSSFHQDGRFDRQRDAHRKRWGWFSFWSHSDLFGDQESGKCHISLHMSQEAKLFEKLKNLLKMFNYSAMWEGFLSFLSRFMQYSVQKCFLLIGDPTALRIHAQQAPQLEQIPN